MIGKPIHSTMYRISAHKHLRRVPEQHSHFNSASIYCFFLLKPLFHDLWSSCSNVQTVLANSIKLNSCLSCCSPYIRVVPLLWNHEMDSSFLSYAFASRHSFKAIHSIVCTLILHHTLSAFAFRFFLKYSSPYTSHYAAIESPIAHTGSLSFGTSYSAKTP